jgi:hypothetical protein
MEKILLSLWSALSKTKGASAPSKENNMTTKKEIEYEDWFQGGIGPESKVKFSESTTYLVLLISCVIANFTVLVMSLMGY